MSLCSQPPRAAVGLVVGLIAGTGLILALLATPGCAGLSRPATTGLDAATEEPMLSAETAPLFDEIELPPGPVSSSGAPLGGRGGTPTSALDAPDRSRWRPVVEVIDRAGKGPEEPSPAQVESAPSKSGDLHEQLDDLLAALVPFHGRDERHLEDGERLGKHLLLRRLIGLHFLLPDRETRHYVPLLAALEEPYLPGTAYSLLRAAFYHDVGLEDLRDRAVGDLPGGGEAHSRPGRFRIGELTLCKQVRGHGDYTPHTRRKFFRDQEVWIYAELENLASEASGAGFRQGVRVEARLLDARGTECDLRKLTNPATEWQVTGERREQVHLCCPYRIPLRLAPGPYELVVLVTDLAAGATDRLTIDLELVQ